MVHILLSGNLCTRAMLPRWPHEYEAVPQKLTVAHRQRKFANSACSRPLMCRGNQLPCTRIHLARSPAGQNRILSRKRKVSQSTRKRPSSERPRSNVTLTFAQRFFKTPVDVMVTSIHHNLFYVIFVSVREKDREARDKKNKTKEECHRAPHSPTRTIPTRRRRRDVRLRQSQGLDVSARLFPLRDFPPPLSTVVEVCAHTVIPVDIAFNTLSSRSVGGRPSAAPKAQERPDGGYLMCFRLTGAVSKARKIDPSSSGADKKTLTAQSYRYEGTWCRLEHCASTRTPAKNHASLIFYLHAE